jgi:hypothetical protein
MRRLFLVETGLCFNQLSAVARPVKVEPGDGEERIWVCQCMSSLEDVQDIRASAAKGVMVVEDMDTGVGALKLPDELRPGDEHSAHRRPNEPS